MTMLAPRTIRTAFVDEPLRIAIGQPHQVALSGMSIAFTAAFFYDALGKLPFLHPWLAVFIAVSGALGAEYAYLKSLSDRAQLTERSPWGDALIWIVCGMIIISGTVVSLKYAYPIPALLAPAWWGAILLTLAHIVPLALLGLCSAQLHAAVQARHAALLAEAEAERRTKEAEVEARAAERRAAEDARQRARQARMDDIEMERLAKLADVEAMEAAANARSRVRAAFAANSPANSPPAVHTASDSDKTIKEAVRAALAANSDANKTELAKRLGIGRTKLYAIIKELKQEG